MSSSETQPSGAAPIDPFKTEISHGTNVYTPSVNNYFASQKSDPTASPGIAAGFDLNAVGDDDEDADGQMIYQGGDEAAQASGEADEIDRRSVYVGNVDYGTTPTELQEHFKTCGAINRITVMVDRYTGHPKGYAYIEFQDESAISNAVLLNDSTFRERQLKVSAKRKNVPGYSGSSRGRGAPSRGSYPGRSFRGGIRGRGRGMRGISGYSPRYRGRAQRGVAPY